MADPCDLTGKSFERLTVVKRVKDTVSSRGFRVPVWECKCICGQTVKVKHQMLKYGRTRSCGCLKAEITKAYGQKISKPNLGRGVGTGICDHCHKAIPFKLGSHSPKERRFCSRQCASSYKSETTCVSLACSYCQKKFTRKIKPSDSGRHFCSTGCWAMSKRDQFTPFRRHLELAQKSLGKIEVSITLQDIKQQWEKQGGKCPYTGWDLQLETKHKKHERVSNQASLDRIDSRLGYVKNNIHFVSLIANYAKNSFTEQDMLRFCRSVTNHVPSLEGRV